MLLNFSHSILFLGTGYTGYGLVKILDILPNMKMLVIILQFKWEPSLNLILNLSLEHLLP